MPCLDSTANVVFFFFMLFLSLGHRVWTCADTSWAFAENFILFFKCLLTHTSDRIVTFVPSPGAKECQARWACTPASSGVSPTKRNPDVYRLSLSPKTSAAVSDGGPQTQELSLQSLFSKDLRVISDVTPSIGPQLRSLPRERNQHGFCFLGPQRQQEFRFRVPGRSCTKAPVHCSHPPPATPSASALSIRALLPSLSRSPTHSHQPPGHLIPVRASFRGRSGSPLKRVTLRLRNPQAGVVGRP